MQARIDPLCDDLGVRFKHFMLLSGLIAAEFAVVYYGADWITAHRVLRIHAYARAELRLPLIPAMVVPYMTMYLIFLLSPLMLRSIAELDRFAGALAWVIVIAGAAFLLFPAQLGFPSVGAADGPWGPWLNTAAFISRPYNLVPSLHVALFTVAAATYALRAPTYLRVLLGIWLIIVTASTLLTHQHHLIDVITGLLLGGWGARIATTGAAPFVREERSSVLNVMRSRCSP
jgi:membrane-associated phospholipid phosphatase